MLLDADSILDAANLVKRQVKPLADIIRFEMGRFLWSKQVEVCQSVEVNRYTTVRSAHGTGKSFLAAQIACAFIKRYPPGDAFVITSAPTDRQVKAILWREIGRSHRMCDLPGRVTLDAQWKVGTELVAYGTKPADLTDATQAMQAFQGIHAKHILVILDEACGIPDWLWTAIDTIITNDNGRVLVIGNPDDPATEFYKTHLPGSGWSQIHISAFDLPCMTGEAVPEGLNDNLTGPEWIKERAKKWGTESPRYISKVTGEFPEISEDTLITPAMVRRACERDLSGEALTHRGQYAADIARFGSDETVAYLNRGGHIRRVHSSHKSDTMKTVGALKRILQKTFNATPMWIDVVGVGGGVFDRLKELGMNVAPFGAGEQAYDPSRYINRRAECFWMLRELFEADLIDIDEGDDDLLAQLVSIKYEHDSVGRVKIETKKDMKKRGQPSPDRADTVAMACQVITRVYETNEEDQSSDDYDYEDTGITGDLMTRPM